MLKGFKAFISRGNMIDLAVGVIIGVAFAAIVKSLTDDILSPLLGKLGGKPNFSDFKPFGIGIGNFINAVINFLIQAAGLYFLIVVPFNRFAKRLAPAPTTSEVLLAEIRDTLRARMQPTGEVKTAAAGQGGTLAL